MLFSRTGTYTDYPCNSSFKRDPLYISCLIRPLSEEGGKEGGKGEVEGGTLQSTGHLGDVMKESTEIAYTYAKVGWSVSS